MDNGQIIRTRLGRYTPHRTRVPSEESRRAHGSSMKPPIKSGIEYPPDIARSYSAMELWNLHRAFASSPSTRGAGSIALMDDDDDHVGLALDPVQEQSGRSMRTPFPEDVVHPKGGGILTSSKPPRYGRRMSAGAVPRAS